MTLRVLLATIALLSLLGCEESTKQPQAAPSRFAAVQKTSNKDAERKFCEQSWPAGEGGKRFVEPPEKPIPGAPAAPPAESGVKGWTWVNLWATWCRPCIEEIGLLARWQTSLQKDGVPLALELWSIDEDEAALTDWLKKTAMPGRVRWLRGQDDLVPLLESLGADKNSAIPVHALVDSDGQVRCVRTGSVHDEDYGSIKSILSGA
jgi:thiol-disulfide isomerase/thioredoxin